jgi:hypothetical protein
MKKQILCFLCLCIPLFCIAQNPLPRQYDYDDAGNRIVRKVVRMPVPPAPTFGDDSIAVVVLQDPDFYTETIAQVEIKIYPNPTTEKITLEIAGWEALQEGCKYPQKSNNLNM